MYATRYSGTVTLTKPFEDMETGQGFPAGTVDPGVIAGKMLIPLEGAGQSAWTGADFELPADLTSIGEGAFSGIAAKAVLVPESVTFVGAGAFAGSGLLKIRFLGQNTGFGDTPFAGRSLVIAFAPTGSTTLDWLSAMPGVTAFPLD